MKLKNKAIFTSVTLFILVFTELASTEASFYRHENSWQTTIVGHPTDSNSSIVITNITDGLGLSMTVHNKQESDLKDIQLNVHATDGRLLWLPKKIYELPVLPAGGSINVHIKIFGIGLGRHTNYPNITITISGTGIKETTKKIEVKLFGPFVRIIIVYPDQNVSYPGYTLFTPEYSQITYLLNTTSSVVHTWNSSYIQGIGLHLLENGNLLRTGLLNICQPFISGGMTGCVEITDWNNTLVWHYEYSVAYQHCLHHGVKMLPNGDILMIAWDYKSAEEAISAGRNPATIHQGQLWPDHIIEVKPTGLYTGDIIWQWHLWDHLIQDYDATKANYGTVADHPELVDINFLGEDIQSPDWNHINAIDYNGTYDQILLSVRNFGEVWVIDHNTTMLEAAGHTGGRYGKGGDLLYRWGNPMAYRTGDAADQKLFGQHDAQWIPSGCPGAGHIIVFNNGVGRPGGQYSSVDEFIPPRDGQGYYAYTPGTAYGPEAQCWIYTADDPFTLFSVTLSGVQRLPNGNTLICIADSGIFYEVTPEKENVWQYANVFHCVNQMYIDSIDVANVRRYALDYPGIKL